MGRLGWRTLGWDDSDGNDPDAAVHKKRNPGGGGKNTPLAEPALAHLRLRRQRGMRRLRRRLLRQGARPKLDDGTHVYLSAARDPAAQLLI